LLKKSAFSFLWVGTNPGTFAERSNLRIAKDALWQMSFFHHDISKSLSSSRVLSISTKKWGVEKATLNLSRILWMSQWIKGSVEIIMYHFFYNFFSFIACALASYLKNYCLFTVGTLSQRITTIFLQEFCSFISYIKVFGPFWISTRMWSGVWFQLHSFASGI
jgi:hypothetical protein